MTTCLGKSCSIGLPRVPFVNCCQFIYLVVSLLVLRAGCGDLIVTVPDHCLSFYFDMKIEQSKEDDLLEIRSMILNGRERKEVQKHYLLVDGLVYFISNSDDDPRLRLFIPKHSMSFFMTQYYDQNGHMGVQKTFDSIRANYYWSNLFKELHKYVSECTVCQTRYLQKIS